MAPRTQVGWVSAASTQRDTPTWFQIHCDAISHYEIAESDRWLALLPLQQFRIYRFLLLRVLHHPRSRAGYL